MVYEKGMSTSRARVDWAGDSLAEATANALTLNIEQGSEYLDTPTGNKYIWDGTTFQELEMKYKDLGLVIDTTVLAAGAALYSSDILNTQWVRYLIAQVMTDQVHDINILTKAPTGPYDTGNIAYGSNPASPAAYRSNRFGFTNNTPLGNGMKVMLKNSSASPTTVAKMRVQLYGI